MEYPHMLDVTADRSWIVVWCSPNIQAQLRFSPGAIIGVDHGTQFPYVLLPSMRRSVLIVEALAATVVASDSYRSVRQELISPTQNRLPYVDSVLDQLKRPLLPHQREFCHYAYLRRGSYNGSEQGTGKTAAAIALTQLWRVHEVKTLIIGPSDLAEQWRQEYYDVMAVEPQFIDLSTGSSTHRNAKIRPEFKGVMYLNYEMLYRMLSVIVDTWMPNTLIADEAWRLKAPDAKVSQAAMLLSQHVNHVHLMSGTPIGNDVGDWFNPLKMLGVDVPWPDRDSFLNRFAMMKRIHTGYGAMAKPVGCQDPSTLLGLMEEGGWFRATKETCLDLPPKQHRTVRLHLLPEQQRWYDLVSELGDGAFDPLSLVGQRVTMIRQQQIVSGFVPNRIDECPFDDEDESLEVADKYRFIGSCKYDWIMQFAENELLGDPTVRVIIWCKFNPEVEAISVGLSQILGHQRVRAITGKVSKAQLNQYKAAFNARSPESDQVFVAQIKKLAYGHNLQSGDHNIDASFTWSHIEESQKQDRTHRQGREMPVTYTALEAINTIDQTIRKAQRDKRDLSTMMSPETV